MMKLILPLLTLISLNAFAGNSDVGSVGTDNFLEKVLANANSLNEQTKILNSNSSKSRKKEAVENYNQIIAKSIEACSTSNSENVDAEIVLENAKAVIDIVSSTYPTPNELRELRKYHRQLVEIAQSLISGNKETKLENIAAFCHSLK
ncbi:MAG: hypothetical protein V4654_09140 [Bdellovibrionota bacterium]